NLLTFSLTNAPVDAAITSASGVFTWSPGSSFANTTNNVTVIVTDDNPYATNRHLNDLKSFQVIVKPPLSFLSTQPVSFTNSAVTLSWASVSGQSYRIQFSTNLVSTNWTALLPDVTATNTTASKTDVVGSNAFRFYRILLVP